MPPILRPLRLKAFHLSLAAAGAFLLTTSQAQGPPPGPLGKLPFEWIDNRIFVRVMLNGQGPFHMILDTGADLSISPEVAKKLQLPLASAGETGGVGEKTVPLQSTKLRELSFGPVRLTNLQSNVIPTDSPYVFGNIPVDGFLGLEVFQHYVVRHDYETGELTFYDPKTYTYQGPGESLPFERDGNIPVIAGTLDGIAGKFGVDTGARSALILYGPFVASNKIDEKYRATFQGVSGWGIGGPVRSYMVRSRSLKIGKFELRDLIARLSLNKSGATASSSKAGLIGPDVLKQFTFICDYPRGRLIFEKNANFGARDHYDRSGMWIAQKGDAFEVFDVIAGGPADQAGLKVGDVILAVNGKSTTQLRLTDVRDQWKNGEPGTAVKLLLQSAAGQKRQVTLELRDLV